MSIESVIMNPLSAYLDSAELARLSIVSKSLNRLVSVGAPESVGACVFCLSKTRWKIADGTGHCCLNCYYANEASIGFSRHLVRRS